MEHCSVFRPRSSHVAARQDGFKPLLSKARLPFFHGKSGRAVFAILVGTIEWGYSSHVVNCSIL